MAENNPPIIHLESVDSTNHEAMRLLERSTPAEGTVILADFQSEGRGQGKTTWVSEAGLNLTFSIIFRPEFLSPARQFLLNQAIALGVRDGIALLLDSDDHILIKWPNDIFWKNHKVSGTLIENQIMGDRLLTSVAGIGINMNQEKFSTSATNAISLTNISGLYYDLSEAFQDVYKIIMKWYTVLRNENHELIRETYLSHLLGLDEIRRFSHKNEVFSGKISGIDEFGRLIIEMTGGTPVAYDVKEVSFLF